MQLLWPCMYIMCWAPMCIYNPHHVLSSLTGDNTEARRETARANEVRRETAREADRMCALVIELLIGYVEFTAESASILLPCFYSS